MVGSGLLSRRNCKQGGFTLAVTKINDSVNDNSWIFDSGASITWTKRMMIHRKKGHEMFSVKKNKAYVIVKLTSLLQQKRIPLQLLPYRFAGCLSDITTRFMDVVENIKYLITFSKRQEMALN
ncbi:hypothetical protein PsorP6_012204 [Peronosclerospora sorghi]|uniref:Uncharacterized protein n=1 Tax=Peronosclerospora sorghi TaxID=230839 RepID=A0ACC0WJ17_9STRA|nr:hypothetical protein PsorP6_012204 [Peronosclerospora sorghi]